MGSSLAPVFLPVAIKQQEAQEHDFWMCSHWGLAVGSQASHCTLCLGGGAGVEDQHVALRHKP